MITEFVMTGIFRIISLFCDIFHLNMEFTIDTGVIDIILNIISMAAFFFPWSYCLPIFAILGALMSYRLVIAFLKFVISFISTK